MAEISEDELLAIQDKIDKLKQSKFKQQMLPAWRPVPSFGSTMVIFGVFGVIFLFLGVTLYIMSNKILSVTKQYDTDCLALNEILPQTLDNPDPNSGKPCTITLTVDAQIEPPIYVYYQLDNFYQNHRRYVKSRSNKQLLGNWLTKEELNDDCAPIITNDDIGRFYAVQNPDKPNDSVLLDKEAPAFPCGLVAKSLFNDTFTIKKDGEEIPFNKNDIAWASDKEHKFKNLEPAEMYTKQWYDIEKENFIVWMRTAGLPNFRKLYAKIEQTLEKGDYELEIVNNFDVSSFEGSKHFVLSTTNVLGGQNYFLAICYIIVGGLCIMFGVIFFIAYMGRKGQGNNQQNAQRQ
jgi:hypothetical protein